ncbi:SDR family NAD(P)-dependent oxidoreductase [Methylobacterium sp. ID0610]|uniref:SDR family NAD(P)-dependent oxidoreductase n=1 Tax=Methylobacterium carpenticola TaxID=3344827 RepID=UPI0036BCD565
MTSSPHGTALVTGASSGIGAAYAAALARRGHDLILVARDRARLADAAARLSGETGIRVEILPADLTLGADRDAVSRRLAADAAIRLLVNAAGLGPSGPALGGAPERYDAMVALNVVALQHLTLAAAEAFAARGGGTIVNLGSVVALVPERFNAPYVATKAYVLALTQALASEVGGKGVRFQAVLPGITRTEIFERAGADLSGIPAAMIMEADDLVRAALAGLDAGELVTIPSLPEAADWQAFEAARLRLAPNLSHKRPAARYGSTAAA